MGNSDQRSLTLMCLGVQFRKPIDSDFILNNLLVEKRPSLSCQPCDRRTIRRRVSARAVPQACEPPRTALYAGRCGANEPVGSRLIASIRFIQLDIDQRRTASACSTLSKHGDAGCSVFLRKREQGSKRYE